MTGPETLFAVLVIVYLLECAVWVRRDAAVFKADFRRLRRIPPERYYGNRARGLVVGNPLPPFGSMFVCQPFPFALSPEAICSHAPSPGGRPSQEEKFFRYEDLRSIGTEGGKLLVNGQLFAHCQSARLAEHLRKLIVHLRSLPPESREKAVTKALEERSDRTKIASEIRAFRKKSPAAARWSAGRTTRHSCGG